MKKLGIVLLSFVFMLGACSDRQPGGGLPDKGPIKYDKGNDGKAIPPDGPIIKLDQPPLPPDGPPPPPPDGPIVPPDGPLPPDMPPIPPDGPVIPPTDGPVIPPTDGPVVPPTDGPVIPPTDGPVIPPADGPVVPPADGPVVPPADGPVITPDMPLPPDMGPLVNNTCAAAKALNWGTSMKIVVKDTTASKANEYGTGINCGNYSTIFASNQVYYTVPLKAGVSYRISLAANYYYPHFYVFTKCGINPINTDCGSSGKTGVVSDTVNSGQTASKLFKPTIGGTYYIAVDGRYPQYTGSFTLTVEEYTPPTNDVCSKAQKITLVNGKGSVSGSTTGAKNEYGTSVGCKQTTGGQPIGMDGPQLYYKVSMTAGNTYDITLAPSYSYAGYYVFRAASCGSATNINNDCVGGSSAHGANDLSITGSSDTMKFTPTLSGDYVIAVDGRRPQDHGAFTLSVAEFKKATNTTCVNAQTIGLVGGKATVTGDTTGVANEFGTAIRCGLQSYYAQDGSQLYYKMFMSGAKQYRITLSPNFYNARVYIWRNTCVATSINADCGSSGKTGDISSSITNGSSGQIYFKPPAGGTYHIAVDSTSTSSYYVGTFSMSIEEYTPPTNGTCAKAKALAFTGAKMTVTGDTTGQTNEFGTQINCGQTSTQYIFDGKQLYYTLPLVAGQSYKFVLTSGAYHGMYIWGAGCYASSINAGCGSGGKTGAAAWFATNSSPQTIIFKAPTTATYHVAVDNTYSTGTYGAGGTFSYTVEKYVPPQNYNCKGAKQITLSSTGTTTVTGDTTGMTNEFGTAINCGNLNNAMPGNQAYYKVNLTAGKSYAIAMTPTFYYSMLYVFSLTSGCGISPINVSCASGGKTGDVSSSSASTGTKTINFTPTTSGAYYIAVDSRYTNRYGSFTLTIQ